MFYHIQDTMDTINPKKYLSNSQHFEMLVYKHFFLLQPI